MAIIHNTSSTEVDEYYEHADFFFICKRNDLLFDLFMQRFALSANSDYFEVVDYERDAVTFSTHSLSDLQNYLNQSADSYHNLYLANQNNDHFMFCYRPESYFVMGIPYSFLDDHELVSLLTDFKAIYGWGWANEPPQDTFAEIEKIATSRGSDVKKYVNGRLINVD